ncbi:MAG TPA: hypothetical protein ENL12_04255 [Dehalococcoidia bacterium]|nr:hypothetical protein [Dehalococcoidia bacterium]
MSLSDKTRVVLVDRAAYNGFRPKQRPSEITNTRRIAMLTTVIGSYPLRYTELGSDAIRQSVDDQVRAGVDLVSDGQTRYDMIEYFAKAIEGYVFEGDKSRVTGKIGRGDPTEFVADFRIAKSLHPHVKGIITGPVTLVFSSLIRGGGYKGYRDLSVYLDTAAGLRDIAMALVAEGAEWIQIDEPFLSVGAPMDIARDAVEHLARDLNVPVAMHVCGTVKDIFAQILQWSGITLLSHAFKGDRNDEVLQSDELKRSNKMLGLGCIDTKSPIVDSKDDVVALLRRGIAEISTKRIVVHPDCGMRMLPRDAAFEKMKIMVAAAREVNGS